MSQSASVIMPTLSETSYIEDILSEFSGFETKQSVSVIMPALDEAECIADVISSIPVEGFRNKGFDVEILVIDNGSTDGTADIAACAGARVVVEPKKGYGNAYLRGFSEAKGDIICTLDADGTYPAEILPDVVQKLINENLDFITTNRFAAMHDNAMSSLNKFGNSLLNLISKMLFQFPFCDSQSGMWIFRKQLINSMDLQSKGMALSQEIKIEAACRLDARCIELPIYYGERTTSPKLNRWRDGFGNLFHLMKKRWDFSSSSQIDELPSESDDYSEQLPSHPGFTYSGSATAPQSITTFSAMRHLN